MSRLRPLMSQMKIIIVKNIAINIDRFVRPLAKNVITEHNACKKKKLLNK